DLRRRDVGVARGEDDVDPVVRGVVGLVREAARARLEDAVRDPLRRQRSVDDAAGREVARIAGVVPVRIVVRGGVDRPRVDGDGRREVDLLPARRRLAGERRLRELRAVRTPEVADVRAGVRRALVEADAGDEAGAVAGELDAQFVWTRISG